MKYEQGDIVFVNLDPAKGNEQKKTRPCLVVSNHNYNFVFNTVLVVPISSAAKYVELEKYRVSPLFAAIDCNGIHGTALLQHIRAIDSNARVSGSVVAHLSDDEMESIVNVIGHFFD